MFMELKKPLCLACSTSSSPLDASEREFKHCWNIIKTCDVPANWNVKNNRVGRGVSRKYQNIFEKYVNVNNSP